MSEIDETALWRACEPMREDGMAISRYLEQLSGLLFLKACESSGKLTFESFDEKNDSLYLPDPYRWDSIIGRTNLSDYEYENDFAKPIGTNKHPSEMDGLERYEEAVEHLKKDGSLAQRAFDQFTPRFNRRSTFVDTIHQIDQLGGWNNFGENADLFGDSYEFLLEKYADKAEGAGEYFTPRPLTNAIVEFIEPEIDEDIIDPAAGTNGFLIQSYNYLKKKTDNFSQVRSTDVESHFASREIRTETYRLGLLNYLLHDIDPSDVNAMRGDSLREEKTRSKEYDLILANPPFGSDISFTYNRKCDSTIEMNFLMMMMDLVNDGGRAAIVVPEGILFDSSKEPARRELLNEFNLDTILALPEDTFQPYSGVDANVLFFERDGDGTDEFWFYDARSDYENIKNGNPLTYKEHFKKFVDYKNNRGECDEYFKVKTDEVSDNYEIYLTKFKEYKYSGHRPPGEITEDINNELTTIESGLVNGEQLSDDAIHTTPREQDIPGHWELYKVQDIVKAKNGGTPSRSEEKYWGGEIDWLSSGEVDGKITESAEESITKAALEETSAKLFPKDSVLVAMYGSGTRGRSTLIRSEMSGNQAICCLEPDTEIITPEYLLHFYKSIRDSLASKARGAAQRNLNQSMVIEESIPVPPLDEQKAIVERIESVDVKRLKRAAQDISELLEEYESSVLSHAFTESPDNIDTSDK